MISQLSSRSSRWLSLLLSVSACGGPAPVADAGRDAPVSDAPQADTASSDAGADAGAEPTEPRLILLSRAGEIVSTDLTSPWTVRASADLGEPIASARCGGGRCYVVHPGNDTVRIVDPIDLSVLDTIALERGASPRDVALLGDHTALITQYGLATLVEVDLRTGAQTSIDLSSLADEDGVPEAANIAVCGERAFVQLRRLDRDGAETPLPALLAVIDLDLPARLVDVDPLTEGTQGIELAQRPAFDMPVDCAGNVLRVAEPRPLMTGGSLYEAVNLETLETSLVDLTIGAEAGGFEAMSDHLFWVISHTEFGPGPSSHLTLEGGTLPFTHNTFANEHVNDLALDRETDQLFFPDPCSPVVYSACETGLVPFHATSGERASEHAIDVGIAPIEVVISR